MNVDNINLNGAISSSLRIAAAMGRTSGDYFVPTSLAMTARGWGCCHNIPPIKGGLRGVFFVDNYCIVQILQPLLASRFIGANPLC